MTSVDEEKPTVQGCPPYGQGLGVVGRGVPGPQPVHGRKFDEDDVAADWPVALGYLRVSAANEVATAMPRDGRRLQLAIAKTLRLIQNLDFRYQVSGHDAMISEATPTAPMAGAMRGSMLSLLMEDEFPAPEEWPPPEELGLR